MPDGDVVVRLDDVAPRPKPADGALDGERFGALAAARLVCSSNFRRSTSWRCSSRAAACSTAPQLDEQQVRHVDDAVRLVEA